MISELIDLYIRFVGRFKYFILVGWAIAVIGCIYPAMKFSDRVTQDIQPPTKSQAYRARQFYRTNFVNSYHSTGFVLFTESLKHEDISRSEDYYHFDRALQFYLYNETLDFPMYDFNISAVNTTGKPVQGYSSFRSVFEAGFPDLISLQYLGIGNDTAATTFGYMEIYDSKQTMEFADTLKDAIEVLLVRYKLVGKFEVTAFSISSFLNDISESTAKDIITMFCVVFPLALIVFCISLASVRYVILPLCSLLATVMVVFALMDLVALMTDVNSLAPGICASLSIAFVLDYNFFVATKYKKEVPRVVDPSGTEDIVRAVLLHEGRTVVISAVALIMSSIGVVFFSIELIRTIGISVVITVFVAMLVTVTVAPSLFLAFPVFFTKGAEPCSQNEAEQYPRLLADKDYGTTASGVGRRMDAEVATMTAGQVRRDRIHYKILQFVSRKPNRYVFVGLVLALVIPCTVYAFMGKYSNDVVQFLGRDSALLEPWKSMQKHFRAGDVFSQSLLIQSPGEYWFDQDFFTTVQSMLAIMMRELPDTDARTFDGACFDGAQSSTLPHGGNISLGDIVGCMNSKTPACIYRLIMAGIFAPTGDVPAMSILVRLQFDPTSEKGREWYYKLVDELFPRFRRDYNVQVYLYGYGADTHDAITFASETLPKIAAIVVAILFIAVSVAFGSLVMPLRCVMTVGVSVATTYGLANLVYVKNMLGFLKMGGLHGTGAIAWVIPLSAFLIVVGVSLNYDLITVVRVLEYRWKGLASDTAVLVGVADTGREVSIAALMMIIIFSGLLFSEVSAMNELGFYLIAAAVVEGYLLRLCFLTPIMSMLGRHNFWPVTLCTQQNFVPPVIGATIDVPEEDLETEVILDQQQALRSPTAAQRRSLHASAVRARGSRSSIRQSVGYQAVCSPAPTPAATAATGSSTPPVVGGGDAEMNSVGKAL